MSPSDANIVGHLQRACQRHRRLVHVSARRPAPTRPRRGRPDTLTIDPDADFASSETCTVTVVAANVTDQDTADPPDTMAADHVFDFTTPRHRRRRADVVISEVYGGGGNAGATLTNDFIELYNRTARRDQPGWLVGAVRVGGTGTTWHVTPLTGVDPGRPNYLFRRPRAPAARRPAARPTRRALSR